MIFFTIATAKRAIFGTDISWLSCAEFDFKEIYSKDDFLYRWPGYPDMQIQINKNMPPLQ